MPKRNRGRLRRVVAHTLREGWEIVLISELVARCYMATGRKRAGCCGSFYPVRNNTKLKCSRSMGRRRTEKSYDERTTIIEVHNICLVSVYQPLWSNGPEGIEEYRHALENEIARTPAGKTLLIGVTTTCPLDKWSRGKPTVDTG